MEQPSNTPPMESAKSTKSIPLKKAIMVTISVFLLSSLLVGGGVYMWQQSVIESVKEDLEDDISELRNTLNKLTGEDSAGVDDSSDTTEEGDVADTSDAGKGSAECSEGEFSGKGMSFTYPCEWTLTDMASSSNFPLKERLSPIYDGSDKVIAVSKSGFHLIITMEDGSEGESGGIFLDHTDYQEFIANKDKVVIDGSTFYLEKVHKSISSYSSIPEGPALWGALIEYIPEKNTGSGNVYKGYEQLIIRNGYTYNFIVTSTEGGTTGSQIQNEVISILETIAW